MSDGDPGQEPVIQIDAAQRAGVWANYARVSHSAYEFTLDFARLDFSSRPAQGVIVARVSLSPLLVTQLIDALSKNWTLYAERAMPQAARDGADDRPRDDGHGESGSRGLSS